VSVVATLAASPAAADQLAGFAGFADLSYAHTSLDLDEDFFGNVDTDGWNGFTIGAGIAFPVAEVPALGWQLDGNYSSQQGDATLCTDPFDIDTCFDGDQSRIVWNLGGSLFLSFPQSRWGINVNYETITDFGSETNAGLFLEWYLANFTLAAKGGWLLGGGTPNGGRGNYLGGQVGGYFIPNLWVGGSVTWSNVITGSTLVGGGVVMPPCFGATCGRRGSSETNYTLDAEFLVSASLPISIFGGYTFSDMNLGENVSNPSLAGGAESDANTFFIGVRFYMGGMGSLADMHRNGNLRGWLRGAN
jgi:hypothetical protein